MKNKWRYKWKTKTEKNNNNAKYLSIFLDCMKLKRNKLIQIRYIFKKFYKFIKYVDWDEIILCFIEFVNEESKSVF